MNAWRREHDLCLAKQEEALRKARSAGLWMWVAAGLAVVFVVFAVVSLAFWSWWLWLLCGVLWAVSAGFWWSTRRNWLRTARIWGQRASEFAVAVWEESK